MVELSKHTQTDQMKRKKKHKTIDCVRNQYSLKKNWQFEVTSGACSRMYGFLFRHHCDYIQTAIGFMPHEQHTLTHSSKNKTPYQMNHYISVL